MTSLWLETCVHAHREAQNRTGRSLRSVRNVLTGGGGDAHRSRLSLWHIGREGSRKWKARGEESVGLVHAVVAKSDSEGGKQLHGRHREITRSESFGAFLLEKKQAKSLPFV